MDLLYLNSDIVSVIIHVILNKIGPTANNDMYPEAGNARQTTLGKLHIVTQGMSCR